MNRSPVMRKEMCLAISGLHGSWCQRALDHTMPHAGFKDGYEVHWEDPDPGGVGPLPMDSRPGWWANDPKKRWSHE